MVVRVVGYTLNDKKQVFIALTSVFGIGRYTALQICSSLEIDPFCRVKDISNKSINVLNDYIYKNYKIGDDLKKEIIGNIKNLITSNSFKGKRLKNGLPVHGQKTRSNAKTSRKVRFIL